MVIMTASAPATAEIQSLESGADDYVAKTDRPETLLLRIRALLRKSGEQPPLLNPQDSDFRPARILVIDDSPTYLAFLGTELQNQGYEVETVASSVAGLALLADAGFDCVLVDLVMPGMDGIEVSRRIAAMSQVPDPQSGRHHHYRQRQSGGPEPGSRIRRRRLHQQVQGRGPPDRAYSGPHAAPVLSGREWPYFRGNRRARTGDLKRQRLSPTTRARVEASTAELRQSATEQTTLLQEVHHRVRNNLQIICSLLSMQISHSEGDSFSGPLNDAYSRVFAMSLIHDQIFQFRTLADINFGEYVEAPFRPPVRHVLPRSVPYTAGTERRSDSSAGG